MLFLDFLCGGDDAWRLASVRGVAWCWIYLLQFVCLFRCNVSCNDVYIQFFKLVSSLFLDSVIRITYVSRLACCARQNVGQESLCTSASILHNNVNYSLPFLFPTVFISTAWGLHALFGSVCYDSLRSDFANINGLHAQMQAERLDERACAMAPPLTINWF